MGPSSAEHQQPWDVPKSPWQETWAGFGEKDGAGAWKRLLDGENTTWERVPALLPRTSLLKGEEEKDQVALGENPGEYDIAEGKRRARQRSVVDWVYFLEKFSEMKVERHYD